MPIDLEFILTGWADSRAWSTMAEAKSSICLLYLCILDFFFVIMRVEGHFHRNSRALIVKIAKTVVFIILFSIYNYESSD